MLIDVDVGRGRVTGRCDPEFSRVGDAFIENFTKRDEVGASVCVNVGGETVVDLWGRRRTPKGDVTWNKLDFYLTDDPREKALRDAGYRAMGRLASQREC